MASGALNGFNAQRGGQEPPNAKWNKLYHLVAEKYNVAI